MLLSIASQMKKKKKFFFNNVLIKLLRLNFCFGFTIFKNFIIKTLDLKSFKLTVLGKVFLLTDFFSFCFFVIFKCFRSSKKNIKKKTEKQTNKKADQTNITKVKPKSFLK